MTATTHTELLQEVLQAFCFEGRLLGHEPYGNGHINDTFLLVYRLPDGKTRRYILQRMNHDIFPKPNELIANLQAVTSFVRAQVEADGGDPDRECMNMILTKFGASCYLSSYGNYWRCYAFVENTICLEQCETAEDFYQSAIAFGRFQASLADFDASQLFEPIPHFHDTPDRFAKFEQAVQADSQGRAASVQAEIDFVRQREAFTHLLMDAYQQGDLPLRVTHNDTKLNNVLLDADTRTALCVIDLDTVMPGFSVTDFGDSIRFGASTALEDEPDLSKVQLSLPLFDSYTKGFLLGCGGKLSNVELDLLPTGAKMMTLECGMRFLTDYLEGDHYFRTHHAEHNLDRCRTQFKLVQEMEEHWDELHRIVDLYR